MEVHDRSMPNHGKLFGLKKKLLAIHDSIAHTEDSLHGKPSSIRTDIEDIIPKIEKADKDMMDWMHNYTAPDDFLPFEEKKAYYIEQKKIIEDVETLMNQAIERSNLLIQNFEKNK